MSDKVLPIPCNGELYDHWTASDYMTKVTEEYNELLEAFVNYKNNIDSGLEKHELACEATDLIIATTSLLEKIGLDETARQAYMVLKNDSNMERDDGRRIRK